MPNQQPITKADLDAFRQTLIADFARQIQQHEKHLLEILSDPLYRSLLTAPLDDEPYTEEQQHQDEEAHASIERGEGIPHEEILKEILRVEKRGDAYRD